MLILATIILMIIIVIIIIFLRIIAIIAITIIIIIMIMSRPKKVCSAAMHANHVIRLNYMARVHWGSILRIWVAKT